MAAAASEGLIPREHGAYGQLALPLATALAAAGVSFAGLLLATTAAATLVAHEPASVLLGMRGTSARRTLRPRAWRWLIGSGAMAAAAGFLALVSMEREVWWSVAMPAIPVLFLTWATLRGRGKSWYGEVAAALAGPGLAIPVALAAGAPPGTAAAIAAPFALLFVGATLAVRTVVLGTRGGGRPEAARLTRRAAFAVSASGTAALGWLVAAGIVPTAALAAAAPGLVTTLALVAQPPPASRLRGIGWTLIAVSALTGLILIAAV